MAGPARRALLPQNGFLLGGAAFVLIAAGAIHIEQAKPHLEEWVAAAGFFIALGTLQVALGVLVARGLRLVVWPAILISLASIALWAVSRTAGLPLGPERGIPEAVGMADLVTKSFEIAAVVAMALVWGQRAGGRSVTRPIAGSLT
jgi:hypothetical protein